MSKLGQFFTVLFRGRAMIDRPGAELSADFAAASARLDAAQSDFARVVREVLDQNERLRAYDAKRSRNPPNPGA